VSQELLTALGELRWEAGTDHELARAVAMVLGPVTGAGAVEVSLHPGHVTVVDLTSNDHPITELATPLELAPGLHRRPRSGWGDGPRAELAARVGATRCVVVPLYCRHTEAYVASWTSRTRVTTEEGDALAAALGIVVDARVLVHRVAKLSRSAHSDNRRLRQSLRDSLGVDDTMRSPAMRRCLERAHAVAPYDTPVLVTGPSGAGKELVARGIHARSSRVTGPFVMLNCGAVPESLAESELFGHRRGAFTGATADHKGLFERATGGTLLLDEVGELSARMQVKLLRVLQEGTFTAVGAEREQHSDARVIAATHRDLAALVTDGSFREDLYYRLAVFEVRVPGLAERPEDFAALVRRVLARTAARMGRDAPSVPRDVMRQLALHDWPGNVRELENVLEGALVMSRGNRLAVPLLLGSAPTRAGERQPVGPLEHSVRTAIETALQQTKGKLYGPGGAAELLDLKPGTLQSKMRKLRIDRARFVR
jgi:transcriptional regulator with GAF, ATPase, and Fis domain